MGHTYSNLLIHVIFSTKDRRPMIQADLAHRLHEYLCGLARVEFGTAVKVGGTEDHIHGLISLRTDAPLAHAMNRWKSLSSGWIHKTFPDMGDFAWQAGYGAFSVSQSSAAAVISYIEGQASHHRRKTFEEEFIEFLKRHQVQFDPAHIWDRRRQSPWGLQTTAPAFHGLRCASPEAITSRPGGSRRGARICPCTRRRQESPGEPL